MLVPTLFSVTSTDRLEVDLRKGPCFLLLILHGFCPSMYNIFVGSVRYEPYDSYFLTVITMHRNS